MSLSRALISYCSQKLASFYELNQRLHKSHAPPSILTAPAVSISTPGIEIKVEPQLQTLMETNEEEDSVFNDHPLIKPDPDQKKPAPLQQEKISYSVRTGKDTATGTVTTQKSGESPAITTENKEERPSLFSWCSHHHSLMLHLSSIVQTIAIQCPTAFVHSKVKSSGKDTGKNCLMSTQCVYVYVRNRIMAHLYSLNPAQGSFC